MGKTILMLIAGGIIAIAIFGDGGLSVSPELSNKMEADFDYTNNSTNDTYYIERWVENENNYFQSTPVPPIEKVFATAMPQEVWATQQGVDIFATALPAEETPNPFFGMPSSIDGLKQWAETNSIQLPDIWDTWSERTQFSWLKAEWLRRK